MRRTPFARSAAVLSALGCGATATTPAPVEPLPATSPEAYELAGPFRGGQAVVCDGCSFEPDGEHVSASCTRCGRLDTTGHLLAPLERTLAEAWSELPPAREGECAPSPPPE